MEKIRLGKTGLMVSRLGFGGIPIQKVSESEAIAVVRRCLELGINYIDTGISYTTSEERIGKAIAGRREDVILATKSRARDRETMESHIKLSLKRLGVEYIDLYQFHNVTQPGEMEAVLAPNGPLTVMEAAKKAGLVRHIGVTSHTIALAIKLVKTGRFETIMVPFNFVELDAAKELLPLTRKLDVGFIAMKPLAGGMLDNVNIAFRYLFQFPDVVPIPGIEKVQEIEEIVRVLEGPHKLTAAEQSEMERLREELSKSFCHRCEYCQPCKEGVPISNIMVIPSFAKRTPPVWMFGDGLLSGWVEQAANCIKCGECEQRCPYGLPIRDMMDEHINWYLSERKKYQEKAKK